MPNRPHGFAAFTPRIPVATASSFMNDFTGREVDPLPLSITAPMARKARETEFLQLWQCHQRKLFGICVSLMRGSQMDAEDALSRALLNAMEKFPRFAEDIQDPGAWLKRLVFNTCITILRERRREQQVLVSAEYTQVDEVATLGSPEEATLRQELGQHLQRLIHSLPVRLQAPVRMRLVQGMEYATIAAEFSISEENARKRVQHGRARLRQQLEQYLELEPRSLAAAPSGARRG